MTRADDFARRLIRLEQGQRRGQTTPQLRFSSVEGGALTFNDEDGNPGLSVGVQFDGTNAPAVVSGPTPSAPTAPTVIPHKGGLIIGWDGLYADADFTPMDFARVTVHVFPEYFDLGDFDPVGTHYPDAVFGSATGGSTYVPTTPGVEMMVVLVTWTIAGKLSEPSTPAVAMSFPFGLDVDSPEWEQMVEDIEDALDLASAVTPVYRQPSPPVAGVAGIPDPIPQFARWFDSDAGNRSYIRIGTTWNQTDSVLTDIIFQTSATASTGIKIGNNALIAYGPGATQTFVIDGITGDVTMAGGLFVGGEIDGAIVRGSQIETSAAADEGIKWTDGGVVAYDTAGDPTFLLDAATGDVVVRGTITSGSTISGATINGGSINSDTDISSLTGKIQTLASKAIIVGNISLTELGGLSVPGVINIPPNASASTPIDITARANLLTAVITNLTLNGVLNDVAGTLKLAGGIVAHKNPPRLSSPAWEHTAAYTPADPTWDYSLFNTDGLVSSIADSNYWLSTLSVAGGSQIIRQHKTTGATAHLSVLTATEGQRGIPSYGGANYFDTVGMVKLGTTYRLLGLRKRIAGGITISEWVVRTFDSAWSFVSDFVHTAWSPGAYGFHTPNIVTDGQGIGIVGCDTGNDLRATWYDTIGVRTPTQMAKDAWLGGADNNISKAIESAYFGTGDYGVGSERYLINFIDGSVHRAFFAGGAETIPTRFSRAPGRSLGLTFDGTRFIGRSDNGRLYNYGRNNVAWTPEAKIVKYDSDPTGTGGTHRTAVGPGATFTVAPRQWLAVDTDPPGDTGNNNDPDKNLVYLDNHLQAEPGVGVLLTYYDKVDTTGAAPGAETFSALPASAGRLISEGGGIVLEGNDSWELANLRSIGGANATIDNIPMLRALRGQLTTPAITTTWTKVADLVYGYTWPSPGPSLFFTDISSYSGATVDVRSSAQTTTGCEVWAKSAAAKGAQVINWLAVG